MKARKSKIGFLSIILLGFNAIVGSGIFLLPNQAMKLIGPTSLFVILFDAFLAVTIALCFAEMGGIFKKMVVLMYTHERLLGVLQHLKLE